MPPKCPDSVAPNGNIQKTGASGYFSCVSQDPESSYTLCAANTSKDETRFDYQLEDMRIRDLKVNTQTGYIRAVKRFTQYLWRSLDTATAEDLRLFQLQMVEEGTSTITMNATVTGLKFFLEVTLEKPDLLKKTTHVSQPRKLPVILSREEVAQLLQATVNPKHQAAL